MNKKVSILFLALFFVFSLGPARAFVPTAPHLLHMVIQKIKRPAGMVCHQTWKIMGRQGRDEAVAELGETLTYLFPGRLRAEILSDSKPRFYVESDTRFIKIADGVATAFEKAPLDFYTDVLLYRDHESLLQQLNLSGVDTNRVSFQRYDGLVCYLIGQPSGDLQPFAGLWIEKESFFPVRYVVEKNNWVMEFVYKDWQQTSKTWYPMQTLIFIDNKLFAKIDVNQVELKSGFSLQLFDVDQILARYRTADGVLGHDDPDRPDKIDELDRQIEEFKKLYE